jgi:hypothetical protein
MLRYHTVALPWMDALMGVNVIHSQADGTISPLDLTWPGSGWTWT